MRTKNVEKLLEIIDPLVRSTYEWENDVNEITFAKCRRGNILAHPDYTKGMYADTFKNLTETQLVFIEDLIRLTKNHMILQDLKERGEYEQAVQDDAEKYIKRTENIFKED